jgi:phenylacetate-CoA ligase
LLLGRGGIELTLEAVFTTGEMLLPQQRQTIEAAFHCPVLDSYGHMERTVGISQCAHGGYHINPEYGVLQVEKVEHLSTDAVTVGAIVGTSLHNLAMPLIRYRSGDLIEIRPGRPRCKCGRSLPLCERILGRTQDVLVTRNGRYVANAFVALNTVQGITWFQIVQHDRDRFEIVVEAGAAFTAEEEGKMKATFGRLVGPSLIEVRRVTAAERAPQAGRKYRSVISHVAADLLA